MKRKPRATISGGFGVGLWLKLMFTFSVVKVHQAESEIHHLYLKRGYVTLEKALSQVVQNQQFVLSSNRKIPLVR